MHQSKNRGGRANPQRQSQNRRNCKYWGMSKLPQRIPNVFHQPESSRSFIRRGLAICSMPLRRSYFALASDPSGDGGPVFGRHPEERATKNSLRLRPRPCPSPRQELRCQEFLERGGLPPLWGCHPRKIRTNSANGKTKSHHPAHRLLVHPASSAQIAIREWRSSPLPPALPDR